MPKQSLLPPVDAVEQVTGRRPSLSTLHRWRLRGVRGVKLQTVLVGGRRFVTEDAVREFIAATTMAGERDPSARAEAGSRDRQIEDAESQLREMGCSSSATTRANELRDRPQGGN